MTPSASKVVTAPVRRTGAWGFGPSLAVAAGATALAGLWLVWTVLIVLPARDPLHVAQWAGIAAGMLAFAALSAASLRAGRSPAWLRIAAAVPGVPAIGLGLGAAGRMLARGGNGGHFEGYVVLLGFILAVHGVVALAHGFSAPPVPAGG